MSTDLKVFAAPVFRGGRFTDHTIPIDVLPQLVAYRNLVREVAKTLFRVRKGRIRVPAGFDTAFQLKLQQVEGDCAVPVLTRPEVAGRAGARPMATDEQEAGDYYDDARDIIANTIDAVARGRPLPEDFPEEFLPRLRDLGSYLADDEALELRGPSREPGPVYTTMVRLLLDERTARQSYSRVAEISGTVMGFDWDPGLFRLRTLDGADVVGRHTSATAHKVLKALQEKKFSRVRVLGLVTYTSEHIPMRVSDIRDVSVWSGTDGASVRRVEDRLQELMQLPAGWLEGEGIPVLSDEVPWLSGYLIELMVDHGLPEPTLFALADGGVQAIWRRLPWRVEADFNLAERAVSLIAINVDADEDDDADIDLTTAEGRREMLAFLRKYLQPSSEDQS